MAADDSVEALVRALLEVLRDGGIERLDAILSPDCKDADPVAGQLPGRTGYAQKVLLFRALFPDAHIVLEEIRVAPPGAQATWTTLARGIGEETGDARWRFTGEFEIEDGRIRGTRLVQRAPVR
jgi:hypothetical protein